MENGLIVLVMFMLGVVLLVELKVMELLGIKLLVVVLLWS